MESDWFTKTERNRVRQSENIDETDREESERKRDRETDREEKETREWVTEKRERAGLIYIFIHSHHFSILVKTAHLLIQTTVNWK